MSVKNQTLGSNYLEQSHCHILFGNFVHLLKSKLSDFMQVSILKIMLLTLFVLLQGCASTVLRPVSEKNKDTTGTYDGRWIGTVTSTSRQQRYGDTIFTCD